MRPPSNLTSSSSNKSSNQAFMMNGPSLFSNIPKKPSLSPTHFPTPIPSIRTQSRPITPTIAISPIVKFPPPPITPTMVQSSAKVFMPPATVITQPTSFYNQITQNPILASNITYTNLTLPKPTPIPGFTFPQVLTSNSHYNFTNQKNMTALGISSDYDKIPINASFSRIQTKVICPTCGQMGMSNVQNELGMASLAWCLMLSPLACSGLCCLCLPECKDRIHYCNCGEVVGYNTNRIC